MRIPLFAALVAAALALPAAHASPVDLYLNSSGDECVFRTDSNGLTPKIGSGAPAGALAASGQFIDQCAGGSQTPPSDAQIEILVPSSYAEDSSTPLALTWRASADHCQLELPANWSGTPSQLCNSAQSCFIGGTADLTTTAGEGNYQVGLTCSRTGGAAITKMETVQVTAEDEEPEPPAGCPAQPLTRHTKGPLTYSGHGTLQNMDLLHYRDTFGRTYSDPSGYAWPNRHGNLLNFPVPRNRYIALQFTVPTSGASPAGHMRFADSLAVPAPQFGQISFSECPGDFGQTGSSLPNECNFQGSCINSSFYWHTTGTPVYQCYLEPGKTYYLNMLSSCESAECKYSIAPFYHNPQGIVHLLGIRVLDGLSGMGSGEH